MTRNPQEPRDALARALNQVDEDDPGILNDISIDEGHALHVAPLILGALAAEGFELTAVNTAQLGDAAHIRYGDHGVATGGNIPGA